jgi:hypothetical protein
VVAHADQLGATILISAPGCARRTRLPGLALGLALARRLFLPFACAPLATITPILTCLPRLAPVVLATLAWLTWWPRLAVLARLATIARLGSRRRSFVMTAVRLPAAAAVMRHRAITVLGRARAVAGVRAIAMRPVAAMPVAAPAG